MKVKSVLVADTPQVLLYFVIDPEMPSLDGLLVDKQTDETRLVPFWSYLSKMPSGIIKETDFHRQLLAVQPNNGWEQKFYFRSTPLTRGDLASAKQYVKTVTFEE